GNGGGPGEPKSEVGAGTRGNHRPVETIDISLIKPAVLLLITAAALDEHVGANAAETKAGGWVVVGIDENVVVEDAEIARGVKRHPHVDVILVVADINVLIVRGLRRVLWIGERQRHAGPVVKQ